MKITLTKDAFIRGKPEKKGTSHEVHNGVGQWLIANGKAKESTSK